MLTAKITFMVHADFIGFAAGHEIAVEAEFTNMDQVIIWVDGINAQFKELPFHVEEAKIDDRNFYSPDLGPIISVFGLVGY